MEIGKFYGNLWEEFQTSDFREYENKYLELFSDELFKDKVCLDAGCGQGVFAKIMAAKSKKRYCLDISSNGLEVAKQYLCAFDHITFLNESFTSISIPDTELDMIVSMGAIHHDKDYKIALQEFDRILKPGGTLLLGMYGSAGAFASIVNFFRPFKIVPYRLVYGLLKLFGVSALNRNYILDYIYTPYRKRISSEEMKQLLSSSFSEFSLQYSHSGWKKRFFGENFYYITCTKK